MKTVINTAKAALLFGSIAFLASCGTETSPITGWNYNDASNGGFEVLPYAEQETGPGLVLIEGGTFTMGRVEQDVNYDWNTIPKRVTISSFYIDETEIRNLDYLEYLHWLNRIYAADEIFYEIYKRALPDTLVWRSRLAYNEPYVDYYLRHPAYRDYPVVGVNWIQASDFCVWRTDRVNEYILIREGILDWDLGQAVANNFNTDAYLAGKYEGVVKQLIPRPDGTERKVRMEDGILLPRYHLPTEAEWEFAAYGLIGNMIEGRILERRVYPWNGEHSVRNPNDKFVGDFMANFVITGGDYMGIAGNLNDAADITAPVYSYWPNDYGLYNMASNVSEWVMDVYRPLTYMDMDDFRPFRGNVFKTAMKDEDGGILIDTDSLLYDDPDTSNQNRNLISRPGLVRQRDVTIAEKEDHLDERRNYKYADNINYRDGDHQSSLNFSGDPPEGPEKNLAMYQYPVAKEKKTIPQEDYQMSLVNDKAHVYKGGSWKDRAYWMVPGTRRFLDHRQAAPWLGFRCAMVRVGSPQGLGTKKR
ncbi:MAG: gliding motility lipoprotein GldJ [Bacteroidetes bacterium]|nr:MAG: gliding motility lipoprotein GldJ [Bacteroidota bacterium]